MAPEDGAGGAARARAVVPRPVLVAGSVVLIVAPVPVLLAMLMMLVLPALPLLPLLPLLRLLPVLLLP